MYLPLLSEEPEHATPPESDSKVITAFATGAPSRVTVPVTEVRSDEPQPTRHAHISAIIKYFMLIAPIKYSFCEAQMKNDL